MNTTGSSDLPPGRRAFVPRWVAVALLMLVLSGGALLVAQLMDNWTIVPAAVLLGAMAAPFALVVWVDDRTRIGRSVPPDVLFITFVVGGGVSIIFVGIFTSESVYHPVWHGWTWIATTEELAKVLVALVICSIAPRYRSVESALALALLGSAGFAWMETLIYGLAANDSSIDEARSVLWNAARSRRSDSCRGRASPSSWPPGSGTAGAGSP